MIHKHDSMGEFLVEANRLAEAEQAYRQALNLKLSLMVQFPDVPQFRLNVSGTHRVLGDLLHRMGREDEAESAYQDALALQRELAAEFPEHLSGTHKCLAKFYTDRHLFGKAAEHYREAVGLGAGDMGGQSRGGRRVPPEPDIVNDAAWLLATCPDPQVRDAGQAVELAEELIRRYGPSGPSRGDYWNTLGVAYYRAGNWKSAGAALQKSMGLRKGGDSFEFFFLAMAHWQLGDKEKASHWYCKATHWMDQNKPQDEELIRFRAEAAVLLGITDTSTTKAKEVSPKKE
jgi:tetratricopeptide (TPR) repeat protein